MERTLARLVTRYSDCEVVRVVPPKPFTVLLLSSSKKTARITPGHIHNSAIVIYRFDTSVDKEIKIMSEKNFPSPTQVYWTFIIEHRS